MQTSSGKNTKLDSSKKNQKGLIIHRNSGITFNTLFGELQIQSQYLGIDSCFSNPIIDDMNLYHYGRSEDVTIALTDFGIEESCIMPRTDLKIITITKLDQVLLSG